MSIGKDWSPEALRKRGFAPPTVIDVGVGGGTPELYEAFPDAHFVLIEPLDEYEEFLSQWLDQYDAEWIRTAVGSEEGSTEMHVVHETLWLSAIPVRLPVRSWLFE